MRCGQYQVNVQLSSLIQELTFYSDKIKYDSVFSVFLRWTLSVAAPSVVSLLAKDSVLAFMHDYTVY